MRSEFEFIHSLKERYGLKAIGDDCAVLPFNDAQDLVITSDLSVQDVDFRLLWATPEKIGHKTLAVSLSDIAAMGGIPLWGMLSIAVPEKLWKTDFLDRFYTGWHDLAHKYGVELVGGDISRTPHDFVVDCTVAGSVPKGKALLRNGAKPKDAIYVSGTLGGAAAGLELLENDVSNHNEATSKQLQPQPQLTLAKLLIDNNIASSCIDISDGLLADLEHICNASSCGAEIAAEDLPLLPLIVETFGIDRAIDHGLNGGEDFELLFTVPEEKLFMLENQPVTRIGMITANVGIIELTRGGKTSAITPKGYQHF